MKKFLFFTKGGVMCPFFVLKERIDEDRLKRNAPAVIPYCLGSGAHYALDLPLASLLVAPHLSAPQRSPSRKAEFVQGGRKDTGQRSSWKGC